MVKADPLTSSKLPLLIQETTLQEVQQQHCCKKQRINGYSQHTKNKKKTSIGGTRTLAHNVITLCVNYCTMQPVSASKPFFDVYAQIALLFFFASVSVKIRDLNLQNSCFQEFLSIKVRIYTKTESFYMTKSGNTLTHHVK